MAESFELKEEAMMYTKKNLMKQLAAMGLKPTDRVMMHASMKAIGPVDGGADTVLDALMEYFEPGMFMMPAHTWAQMNESYNVFNPATEPSCVGLLSNMFMKRPGVVRSLHPTHSIAAWGRDAAAFAAGEENCTTPCSPGGCWNRLYSDGAKILLVGVTHVRNTYIHAVEEMLDVPERIAEKPTEFTLVMPDGSRKRNIQYRHYNRWEPHVSNHYDKLKEAYFETGAARQACFGDAACILCDCRALFRVTKHVLSHQINAVLELDEIPRSWWANYRKE